MSVFTVPAGNMFGELQMPGGLPIETPYASDLMMELQACMVECRIACEEAYHVRSSLSFSSEKVHQEMLSIQHVWMQQDELVEEKPRGGLDKDGTGIDKDSTSTRIDMCVAGICAKCPSVSLNHSVHTTSKNYTLEPALQTTHHSMDDAFTEPMRSPLQTMPGTHREGAMELSQPILEMSTGTPQVAASLLPAASASHGSQVPMGLAQPPALDLCVTTLIVRSVPPKISQEDLIALWPPTWGYHFVHLPYSFKQRRSVGYAFIDFVSNTAANSFYNQWQGSALTVHGRTKAVSLQAAHVQGLLANLEHLKQHGIEQVFNAKYLPALFLGSDRICFKAVLKELQIAQHGVMQ